MGGVRYARADRTGGLGAVSRLLRATRVRGGRRPALNRGRRACLALSSALANLYGNPPTAEAPARPPQPDQDRFLSRLAAWARSVGNNSGKSSLAIQRRAGPCQAWIGENESEQIGRASCRERVEVAVGAGTTTKK